MLAVTVDFKTREQVAEEFLCLVRSNAETSLRLEVDCLRFDVCWNENDKTQIFLYELYRDKAAFETHLSTAHFRAFDTAVADMLLDKSVRAFRQVG